MTETTLQRELKIIQQNVVKEIGETFKKIESFFEQITPKSSQCDNLLTTNEHITSELFDYYAQIKLLNSNLIERTLRSKEDKHLKIEIPEINDMNAKEKMRLKNLNTNGQFDYIDYDKKLVKFLQDGDCTSMASFISLFKDCSSFVYSPKGEGRKLFKGKFELKNSLNDQNFNSNNIIEKQSSIICRNPRPLKNKKRSGLSSLNISSVERREYKEESTLKTSMKISDCERFVKKSALVSTRNGESEKENTQPSSIMFVSLICLLSRRAVIGRRSR